MVSASLGLTRFLRVSIWPDPASLVWPDFCEFGLIIGFCEFHFVYFLRVSFGNNSCEFGLVFPASFVLQIFLRVSYPHQACEFGYLFLQVSLFFHFCKFRSFGELAMIIKFDNQFLIVLRVRLLCSCQGEAMPKFL